MAAGTPHNVRLHLPLVGPPEVVVDGDTIDPSTIYAVACKTDTSGVTKFYLEVYADVEVEGEGLVHVVHDRDQAQVIGDWLANLNASEVNRLVLERIGMREGTPVELTLELLREWAAGA